MNEAYQAGTRGVRCVASKGLALVVMESLLDSRLADPPANIRELWDKAECRRSPARLLRFVPKSCAETCLPHVEIGAQPGSNSPNQSKALFQAEIEPPLRLSKIGGVFVDLQNSTPLQYTRDYATMALPLPPGLRQWETIGS